MCCSKSAPQFIHLKKLLSRPTNKVNISHLDICHLQFLQSKLKVILFYYFNYFFTVHIYLCLSFNFLTRNTTLSGLTSFCAIRFDFKQSLRLFLYTCSIIFPFKVKISANTVSIIGFSRFRF